LELNLKNEISRKKSANNMNIKKEFKIEIEVG
jgi:hypothetical protein